ncbi:CBS domain-containing protein [Paracoccus sp. MC1862]|nr:CBS domain-containing protein [Paracoccus sp. MC1854]MBB1496877.1 CBS domain-containing protein [Paracoccus sp. MC1862]QQO46309.1 CBS domain-containing protein [Paracoccus sp. MC1862]
MTSAAGHHAGRETLTLLSSQVRDAFLRKPFFVDGDTDIVTLCRLMAENGVTDALVRDGAGIGIFTTTNLRDVLLMDRPPAAIPVREVASFPAVSVPLDAELIEAMILMLRHRVHRVAVHEGRKIVGVLGQLDLMSFVANHSHLIAIQAAQAGTVAELKKAADQIAPLIAVLHEDGVRVEVIARLVGELNRAVFRRLWELVAPEDLRAASCLIVMGSEGRGEQIMRTDQDNGLILPDGFPEERAEQATAAFTAALVDFGYPPCPGGIMASRPDWRRTVSGYRAAIGEWIHGTDPEGPMNLAIFMDALPVAGDTGLLDGLKAHMGRLIAGNDAYLARFAASANSFAEDGSWWSRLPGMKGRAGAEIDIKKLGIFPIVQGTRALALQYRIPELSTAERLRALASARRIRPGLARDLTDALHLLMGVKLDNNLAQMAEGRVPDNLIRIDALGTLNRQGLKQALAIVRDFRGWLVQHFRLVA